MNILFGIPIPLGLFCFFLFCVLYAGIGGIVFIHGFAFFQVICLFAAAILIPVYFFIVKGVEHVYEGIRLYHPYLLVLNNYEGLFFIATGMVVVFEQIFVDQASWQRLYMMEEKKIVPTFLLSGLILATIPLAFSALIMIVIFTGGSHLDQRCRQLPACNRLSGRQAAETKKSLHVKRGTFSCLG